MDKATVALKKLLKEHGLSVTGARLAVFRALHGQEPLTMHDLVEGVAQVDRASVYRTVELFERIGVVQRVSLGWKYKLELSDLFAEHHHHLTCTNCGRSIELNLRELETTIDKLARGRGFTPSAHQIEIQGLCQACRLADIH